MLNSRLSAYGQSNIKNLANQATCYAWPATGNRPVYIESCASGHYSTTHLIHVAPAPNVNDQTDTDKGRQYRKSTVTQKWQWNSDDREEPDNHRNIDDHVKEKHPDNAHNNKHPEAVPGSLSIVKRTEQNEREQSERARTPRNPISSPTTEKMKSV